jgi:hypothetical protein
VHVVGASVLCCSRVSYLFYRGPYPIADLTKALAFEDDTETEEVCRFYGLIDVMESTSAVVFGKRNLAGIRAMPLASLLPLLRVWWWLTHTTFVAVQCRGKRSRPFARRGG